MQQFSKLANKQAGRITVGMILAGHLALGAMVYGVYSWKQEADLVDNLKAVAASMSSEMSSKSKIDQYFADEMARIEKRHAENQQKLAGPAADLKDFLPLLASGSSLEELSAEEGAKYRGSLALLSKEREIAGKVWRALVAPEQRGKESKGSYVDDLKAGLTKDNLQMYSSLKDCALRQAGEGAYCGPMAAFSTRLDSALSEAKALSDQSEAYGREQLASGWDEWDGAEGVLISKANSEIDQARQKAYQSYVSGDLDKDDWDDMEKGFAAAKQSAAEEIKNDRKELQNQVATGTVHHHNWFLFSNWANSYPSSHSHVVSNAYMPGGSAFVPSSQFSTKLPGATGFVGAKGASPAAGASPLSFKFSAPGGTSPYSANSSSSKFGSKVGANFAKAAGPRLSMASASSSKGGLSGRVGSVASSRAASRSSAFGGGRSGGHGVSAGHGSSGG